ncbi:M48 family metalloprotease [Lentzea sp. NPDC051213]|uniref:M48 family metalloprotease n=1 Tax=Lentzea sp. NPDC051213 TaxID=3364126 RepID=UPI00379FBF2A
MNQGERSRVPSGTTLRFVSVVLLATATTLQMFGHYAAVWPMATNLDNARCQVRSGLYLTSTHQVDPDQSKWDGYRACMATFLGARALWLVGGLVLLAAVALLIYLVRPSWRVRRRGLVLVPEELNEPLAALVDEAGLAKAPVFLLDRTNVRVGGVAFGNHRHKYVALNAGMLALRRTDPAAFRAIVLHELAHVRADVTVTYATLAIWRAFVIAVLVPYALTLVNPMLLSRTPFKLPVFGLPSSSITFGMMWRLAVMTLLVFAARIAVLRAREKYADALVVRWTGDSEPYRTLPPTGWFRRWFGHHPAPAARLAVMRDPDSLLRPGFWEVLGSALAVQIAWWHTIAGLRDVTWYREGNESFVVMRIVWVIAIAALIGLVAWRGAAFGPVRGTFALPGLAIGLGLVFGDRLDVQNLSPVTVPGVIAAAVLIATTTLVTVWVGYCATLVRNRWHAWFLGLSAAVVTYTLLGWFAEVRLASSLWNNAIGPVFDLLGTYTSSTVDDVVLKAVAFPFLWNFNRVLTVVALALVWLVPLVLRREFPRFAALAGAAGGLLAAAAVVLTGSLGSPLVATAWQVVAVVAVQLVVTLVVARRVDRVGALFTAWLIGLAATATIWLTHLQDGAVDSVLATRPHQVLPVLGTLVALVGGLGRPSPNPARPWGLIAIAVVSVGVSVWWPKAIPTAAPLQPPAPQDVEVNTDEAVNTWIYGGGWDRMMAVVRANDQVFAGVRANDPAAIAVGCDALVPVVREEFPAPPDDRIATMWRDGLVALENGARSCLVVFRDSGADDGSMAREFGKGLEQLKVVQTELLEAQNRVIS